MGNHVKLQLQEDIEKIDFTRKYEETRGYNSRHKQNRWTYFKAHICPTRVGEVGVRSNTAGEDVLALTTESATLATLP